LGIKNIKYSNKDRFKAVFFICGIFKNNLYVRNFDFSLKYAIFPETKGE